MGMLRIYKYAIPIEAYFSLELPRGAKILTMQEQRGKPQIWALVNPESSTEIREFCIVGTGDMIDDDEETLEYIGTLQIHNGVFRHLIIGHLFEIRKKARGKKEKLSK